MSLPTVTQVLKPWADFSMVRPEVLAMAAERGTDAHRICAAILRGLWVPSIPEDCRGFVLSFRSWLPFVQDIHLVEGELIDPALGFAGHPDMIVTLKGDSRPAVIDLKTPATKCRLWRAQLAAYKHLAIVNDWHVNRVASLRLKRDGSRPIFDEYTDSAQDMAAFTAALNAHRWFKQAT